MAMRVLLLVLALLLGSCTTTHTPITITEEEAHEALLEVLHLASQGMDTTALTSLPLSVLLGEERAHLADRTDVPLMEQRLATWQAEVSGAYRFAARALAGEFAPLLEHLTIPNAQQVVQNNKISATSIFKAQASAELASKAEALLRPALDESQAVWRTLSGRYEIWRRSRILLAGAALPPLPDDLFDHLLALFIDGFLASLEKEEMLLRTTPVVKGSGSILEVFQ